MNTSSCWLRAKSFLLLAIFAGVMVQGTRAAEVDDRTIDGFDQTAAAFLEVKAYRPAHLFVYQTASGADGAVLLYSVGSFTFGYCPQEGSHLCPRGMGGSPLEVATVWSKCKVIWATERSTADLMKEGIRLETGQQYPNGCLLDSLFHYLRLSHDQPHADWKGVFILQRGPRELGSGHAVLIYLLNGSTWVYDPAGRITSFMGKVNLQESNQIAHRIDPESEGGGWLEAVDIAFARQHPGQSDPSYLISGK